MKPSCTSISSSSQRQQQPSGTRDWLRFQTDVTHCWVGEAVAQVAERAVASGSVESVVLCGLRAPTREAANPLAFVQHFERLRRLEREDAPASNPSARDHELGGSDIATSVDVADAEEFKAWLATHKQQQLAQARHSRLVVLYAPMLSPSQEQELAQTAAQDELDAMQTLLLMIRDPSGLVDVSTTFSVAPPRCYRLAGPRELVDAAQSTLVCPLERLARQCGLHFMVEIARWTVFKDELLGTSEEPAPLEMLASVAHMPFQLLLQLLRWSHFHPTLVRALAKPFKRKLRLIPQARIRDAIIRLHDSEMAIWSRHDACDDLSSLNTVRRQSESGLAAGFEIPYDAGLGDKRRLSDCQLWDVQKQFYVAQGIHAWSDGIIPFGVSSSSFLAAAYARVVFEFFMEVGRKRARGSLQHQRTEEEPNCFIWEAASGSCKFLHAFLVHFYQLVDANASVLASRGLRFCVIGSDLSDQVLDSRMGMPCFESFLSDRRLDFARFDSAEFIHGDHKRQLRLKHSRRIWHVGRDGPVFLMGNYFLDSLRADVFAVTSAAEEVLQPASQPPRLRRSKVYQGRVDPHIASIIDMKLSFEQVEPVAKAVYDDAFVNQVLLDIFESIDTSACPKTSSALVLFPVEAIQLLRTLVGPDSSHAHPVGILLGDASFSFRDPISSAFFGVEDGADVFEIPQLSPHPDCFCLPVDFEVLRIFLRRLGLASGSGTSAQVASAISTDTFDVLHGTVFPSIDVMDCSSGDGVGAASTETTTPLSQVGFTHEFASFTPSDCDLLWGMMGVDNGAAHFSLKPLLSLLAQSAWDFDLFVILQWRLMWCWRASSQSDALRLQLVSIANRCWTTYYALENEDASHSLALLQHSRWLYMLGAHDDVVAVLTSKIKTDSSLASNPSICYVLGLAFFGSGDLWRALTSFRKCVAVDPNRLKFKRRVAETLLALQRQRLADRVAS